MNVEKVSLEDMQSAAFKYNSANRGIIMTNIGGPIMSYDGQDAQKEVAFANLCDPKHTHDSSLEKMLETIYRKLKNVCPDPILKRRNIIAVVKGPVLTDVTTFTLEDAYLLIRFALFTQRDVRNKIKSAQRQQEIMADLAALETPKDRRKRLQEELEELQKGQAE